MTSKLIGRYIRAARLQEPDGSGKTVAINSGEADEVLILKQITRDYVINNPSLAAQNRRGKNGSCGRSSRTFSKLENGHSEISPCGCAIFGWMALKAQLASLRIASRA